MNKHLRPTRILLGAVTIESSAFLFVPRGSSTSTSIGSAMVDIHGFGVAGKVKETKEA